MDIGQARLFMVARRSQITCGCEPRVPSDAALGVEGDGAPVIRVNDIAATMAEGECHANSLA